MDISNRNDGEAFSRHNRIKQDLAQAIRRVSALPSAKKTVASVSKEASYTASDLLTDFAKTIDDDVFRLAVVGEYSAGKSSLLNVMLDMVRKDGAKTEGELPTSVLATTAVVTTIRFSPQLDIELKLMDGTTMSTTPDELASFLASPEVRAARIQFKRDRERNDEIASKLREVDLGWNSKILSYGVQIQDTPGLGSTNSQHGDITRREVAKVDAVIFLFAVDPPMGEAELTFLQYVVGFTDKFLFVQNKKDLGFEKEQGEYIWKRRENEHRKAICKVIGDRAFDIHHVSAAMGASAKRGSGTEAQEDWEESGFPRLLEVVEKFLVDIKGKSRISSWFQKAERVISFMELQLAEDAELRLNRINSIESEIAQAADTDQWEQARVDLASFGKEQLQRALSEIDRVAGSVKNAVSSAASSACYQLGDSPSYSDISKAERTIVRAMIDASQSVFQDPCSQCMSQIQEGIKQTLSAKVPDSMRKFLTSSNPARVVESLQFQLSRSSLVDVTTYEREVEPDGFLEKVGDWFNRNILGKSRKVERYSVSELDERYLHRKASDLADEAIENVRDSLESAVKSALNSADEEVRRIKLAAEERRRKNEAILSKSVTENQSELESIIEEQTHLRQLIEEIKKVVQ